MATRYPAEFRERAVELARLREKPVKQLATDLGISEQTLHNWVKARAQGRLVGLPSKSVSAEQMELSRLRAELARVKMERDILKKATAYFAREST